MKKNLFIALALVISSATFANNTTTENADRPYFNKKKDLLLAQFDSKPDPDDVHAQAALGAMMLHKDLKGVKIYAVSGAIGEQKGVFLDSEYLFNMIFGKRWTAANKDWDKAVADIVARLLPVLKKGGKVWVQEAGQSDITADWIAELLKTLPAETIKTNVIVVQHSNWNEKETNDADLAYVKKMTHYFSLDDGNDFPGEEKNDRGPHTTPRYRADEAKWIKLAKESANKKAAKLWTEADRVIDHYHPKGFKHSWSSLSTDGVDYSDCVEDWWILNLGDKADTHEKIWERYVTNK